MLSLFAHAGHEHGAGEMCCSTLVVAMAGLALAVGVIALVVTTKKSHKK